MMQQGRSLGMPQAGSGIVITLNEILNAQSFYSDDLEDSQKVVTESAQDQFFMPLGDQKLRNDGENGQYPHDVIQVKMNSHFRNDFNCLRKLPGVRSSVQNYEVQCHVTSQVYLCYIMPLKTTEDISPSYLPNNALNFRALMRKLDHFALPRLVQENQKGNQVQFIMVTDAQSTSKPSIKSLNLWTQRHRGLF